MTNAICLSWLFIHCLITGPGVHSEWDLTKDGQFDLKDIAEVQNGWFDNKYRFCCIDEDCSSFICQAFGL